MSRLLSDDSLDKSTYEYFSHVLDRLNNKFDDDDDKEIYLKNVLKATVENEIQLSTHSKLSHAVEGLLKHTTTKQLIKFIDGISDDFYTMTTHPAASHVMQSCLERTFDVLLPQSKVTEDKIQKYNSKLTNKVIEYSDWAISNVEDNLNNNYACHVMCTLLETLSGRRVSDQVLRSKKTKAKSTKCSAQSIETPKEFRDILQQLIGRITENENIIGVINEVSSSAVLQTILLISSKVDPKSCEKLVTTLSRHLFNHSKDLGLPMTNCVVTPLIEKVIDVATVDQLANIQKKYFKGNLKKFVVCPAANYVVQHLIKKCPSKEQFEVIYEEVADLWTEISNIGHLGLFVALSETCMRLNAFQANFTQRLAELLECWEPKERKMKLVPLLSTWQTYQSYTDHSKTNYHGSLILQNLFNFQKPIVVSDSLLQMQIGDLIKLCSDPCGSHVIDGFVQSKTVGEKRRQSLIEKLKGHMVNLSCDKFGSRCVETMWRSSDMKLRLEMVEELVENRRHLRNQYGYFVYNLCDLDLYKSQPKQWKDNQSKTGKRKSSQSKLANKQNKTY